MMSKSLPAVAVLCLASVLAAVGCSSSGTGTRAVTGPPRLSSGSNGPGAAPAPAVQPAVKVSEFRLLDHAHGVYPLAIMRWWGGRLLAHYPSSGMADDILVSTDLAGKKSDTYQGSVIPCNLTLVTPNMVAVTARFGKSGFFLHLPDLRKETDRPVAPPGMPLDCQDPGIFGVALHHKPLEPADVWIYDASAHRQFDLAGSKYKLADPQFVLTANRLAISGTRFPSNGSVVVLTQLWSFRSGWKLLRQYKTGFPYGAFKGPVRLGDNLAVPATPSGGYDIVCLTTGAVRFRIRPHIPEAQWVDGTGIEPFRLIGGGDWVTQTGRFLAVENTSHSKEKFTFTLIAYDALTGKELQRETGFPEKPFWRIQVRKAGTAWKVMVLNNYGDQVLMPVRDLADVTRFRVPMPLAPMSSLLFTGKYFVVLKEDFRARVYRIPGE